MISLPFFYVAPPLLVGHGNNNSYKKILPSFTYGFFFDFEKKVMYMCVALQSRFVIKTLRGCPRAKQSFFRGKRSSSLVEMGPAIGRKKKKKTKSPRRHPFSSGR